MHTLTSSKIPDLYLHAPLASLRHDLAILRLRPSLLRHHGECTLFAFSQT